MEERCKKVGIREWITEVRKSMEERRQKREGKNSV